MGFGLGCSVYGFWGLGFSISGLGCRVYGLGRVGVQG